ncbi:sugar phosphate isomerase/epimerase [Pedobacter sp. MC2016-14]|uniref:sugar phosphate isomerase/epimerase family protein n=1 Tax=Pedobacter sp. MC2016-14 TaxID=2897327 RepID=UPI001E28F6C8|nr:sugar phosphate isomerase/epimerase [Pedobacter sp. MC2016-14]MCD0486629.1 sugar phosphate isomerase/epimerase [Pedobacter sp. MC2016-14]
MSNRRTFLQQTGLAAVAALVSQRAFASALGTITAPCVMTKHKIGIQLFTLRELLMKDVKSTITEVSKIGYNQVETYYGYPGAYETKGFWGLNPKEFKVLLAQNNLSSPAGHYNTTAFLSKDGTDEVLKSHVETAATVGQKYFIIPGLPADLRKNGTLDDYKEMAAKFNTAAELCAANGLKLAYHNHNFEFKDQGNGQTGFEILLKETDPKLVNFELDLFWAVNAGLDPLALFANHPGRFKLWHVKDMDKADKNVYTEVGTGSIDFKSIFKAAKLSGVEYFLLEQDVIKIDPYQSITQSLNYVKETLLK